MVSAECVSWQELRALCNCELWNGNWLTAPYQEWVIPEHPPLVPMPEKPVCYLREPWRVGRPKAQPVLEQMHDGVLVTTFCDPPITQRAADCLDALPIRHWFGVQVWAQHPKVTAMPLGIDRRDVGMVKAAERRPWADRDVLLYASFAPRYKERRRLLGQFAHDQHWVRIRGGLSVAEYCADLGRSRFVLSPPGRGWDCYRTYEALAMGAVPIVRRYPRMSHVVEGLPVLLVDDWSEVTRERLEAYEPPASWNLERMTLPYWVERIKEHSGVESV